MTFQSVKFMNIYIYIYYACIDIVWVGPDSSPSGNARLGIFKAVPSFNALICTPDQQNDLRRKGLNLNPNLPHKASSLWKRNYGAVNHEVHNSFKWLIMMQSPVLHHAVLCYLEYSRLLNSHLFIYSRLESRFSNSLSFIPECQFVNIMPVKN